MGKPISPRKRKYLNGLVNGKTKQQAALDAGYSPSTALSAKAHIETPEVRAAFAELIRERIPARRIAERISEGLDAMKTEFFQKDGVVVETRDVIAWSERRMYAELAAEYGKYHTPQVNVTGNITHKLSDAEIKSAANSLSKITAFNSDSETPLIAEVVNDEENS